MFAGLLVRQRQLVSASRPMKLMAAAPASHKTQEQRQLRFGVFTNEGEIDRWSSPTGTVCMYCLLVKPNPNARCWPVRIAPHRMYEILGESNHDSINSSHQANATCCTYKTA